MTLDLDVQKRCKTKEIAKYILHSIILRMIFSESDSNDFMRILEINYVRILIIKIPIFSKDTVSKALNLLSYKTLLKTYRALSRPNRVSS